MEDFCRAKTVRLRSHHRTYLADDDNGDSVRLLQVGSSRSARWSVEPSPSSPGLFRLRSSHGRYLSASDKRFLLGASGRKVVLLPNPQPSSEWKPLRDGPHLKLQTRQGSFLRGNGGVKPYKGTVTHDDPHRTLTQDWVLWEVDVLEIAAVASPTPTVTPKPPVQCEPARSRSGSGSGSSTSLSVGSLSRKDEDESESEQEIESELESESDSPLAPQPRPGGFGLTKHSAIGEERTIKYYIVDDEGMEDENSVSSFIFHGSSVADLKQALEEATGLQDVILCIHDIINDRLLRLRLNLPPNRKTMTLAVVPSSSPVAASLDN